MKLCPGMAVEVLRPHPTWSREGKIRGPVVQVTDYIFAVRLPAGFCESFIIGDPQVHVTIRKGAV